MHTNVLAAARGAANQHRERNRSPELRTHDAGGDVSLGASRRRPSGEMGADRQPRALIGRDQSYELQPPRIARNRATQGAAADEIGTFVFNAAAKPDVARLGCSVSVGADMDIPLLHPH